MESTPHHHFRPDLLSFLNLAMGLYTLSTRVQANYLPVRRWDVCVREQQQLLKFSLAVSRVLRDGVTRV